VHTGACQPRFSHAPPEAVLRRPPACVRLRQLTAAYGSVRQPRFSHAPPEAVLLDPCTHF
jgi:hypothetical protein